MDNKNIFASNLSRYMDLNGKSRKDVAEAIGVSYYTFTDWVKGKKYPRMDKVEKLANYFGILKSDLIEEKSEERKVIKQKNNAIVDLLTRMRTDSEFVSVVEGLSRLDTVQLASVKQVIDAFLASKT